MRQPSVISRRVAAAVVVLVVGSSVAACGPKESGSDTGSDASSAAPAKGGTLSVLNRTPR